MPSSHPPPLEDTTNQEKVSLGMFTTIRNQLFTGIIIALPIILTTGMIMWVIDGVDRGIKPLIPAELNPESYLNIPLPGLGLVIVIIGLWILGVVATNFLGNRIIKIGENLLARVPLVRNVYGALKQIVETIAQQKNSAFREVCMIEYPRKGVYAIGFVTATLTGAPRDKLPKEYDTCVFVPTTPNPTSGVLLIVKREELIILDMTPEEGAKLIISAGMVTSNKKN